MAHYNHTAVLAKEASYRALQRPRILSMYRDLMKQIGQFTKVTNPYDDHLAERLTTDTRKDFKGIKSE